MNESKPRPQGIPAELLDAALSSLSLEQRISVKAHLLRAGLLLFPPAPVQAQSERERVLAAWPDAYAEYPDAPAPRFTPGWRIWSGYKGQRGGQLLGFSEESESLAWINAADAVFRKNDPHRFESTIQGAICSLCEKPWFHSNHPQASRLATPEPAELPAAIHPMKVFLDRILSDRTAAVTWGTSNGEDWIGIAESDVQKLLAAITTEPAPGAISPLQNIERASERVSAWPEWKRTAFDYKTQDVAPEPAQAPVDEAPKVTAEYDPAYLVLVPRFLTPEMLRSQGDTSDHAERVWQSLIAAWEKTIDESIALHEKLAAPKDGGSQPVNYIGVPTPGEYSETCTICGAAVKPDGTCASCGEPATGEARKDAGEQNFSGVLEQLRNVSHDDLDDAYAGPCPSCGGKQIYDRSVPWPNRPINCINRNCEDYCGDENLTKALSQRSGPTSSPAQPLLKELCGDPDPQRPSHYPSPAQPIDKDCDWECTPEHHHIFCSKHDKQWLAQPHPESLPALDLKPVCGLCKGTGKVSSFGFASAGDMDAVNEPSRIERSCRICKGKGWVYLDSEELTAALLASQQECQRLREQVAKLTIWSNCGGAPSGKFCSYDPQDVHEIHGGGLIEEDGKAICELHQLRRAEARIQRAKEQLKRAQVLSRGSSHPHKNDLEISLAMAALDGKE